MCTSRIAYGLTQRQIAVLKGIAEDKTTDEIASDLRIHAKTVYDHRMRICRILRHSSTAWLTQFALKQGIANWVV